VHHAATGALCVISDSGVTHAINGAAHESSNSSMTPKWRTVLILVLGYASTASRVQRALQVRMCSPTRNLGFLHCLPSAADSTFLAEGERLPIRPTEHSTSELKLTPHPSSDGRKMPLKYELGYWLLWFTTGSQLTRTGKCAYYGAGTEIGPHKHFSSPKMHNFRVARHSGGT
jgi:hypothetical protein